MRCYSCRKYDNCELPWKCSSTMYDCSAYELEQTNEDWIKQCTTEQLAEWIFQIFGEGVAFGETHGKTKLFPNDDIIHEGLVVEWLKEKHE